MFARAHFAGAYFPGRYFAGGAEAPAVADEVDPFWSQVAADTAAIFSQAGAAFGLARQVVIAGAGFYGLWQPARVVSGEWRPPFVVVPTASASGIVAGTAIRVDGVNYQAAGVPMPSGLGWVRVVLDLGPVP